MFVLSVSIYLVNNSLICLTVFNTGQILRNAELPQLPWLSGGSVIILGQGYIAKWMYSRTADPLHWAKHVLLLSCSINRWDNRWSWGLSSCTLWEFLYNIRPLKPWQCLLSFPHLLRCKWGNAPWFPRCILVCKGTLTASDPRDHIWESLKGWEGTTSVWREWMLPWNSASAQDWAWQATRSPAWGSWRMWAAVGYPHTPSINKLWQKSKWQKLLWPFVATT